MPGIRYFSVRVFVSYLMCVANADSDTTLMSSKGPKAARVAAKPPQTLLNRSLGKLGITSVILSIFTYITWSEVKEFGAVCKQWLQWIKQPAAVCPVIAVHTIGLGVRAPHALRVLDPVSTLPNQTSGLRVRALSVCGNARHGVSDTVNSLVKRMSAPALRYLYIEDEHSPDLFLTDGNDSEFPFCNLEVLHFYGSVCPCTLLSNRKPLTRIESLQTLVFERCAGILMLMMYSKFLFLPQITNLWLDTRATIDYQIGFSCWHHYLPKTRKELAEPDERERKRPALQKLFLSVPALDTRDDWMQNAKSSFQNLTQLCLSNQLSARFVESGVKWTSRHLTNTGEAHTMEFDLPNLVRLELGQMTDFTAMLILALLSKRTANTIEFVRLATIVPRRVFFATFTNNTPGRVVKDKNLFTQEIDDGSWGQKIRTLCFENVPLFAHELDLSGLMALLRLPGLEDLRILGASEVDPKWEVVGVVEAANVFSAVPYTPNIIGDILDVVNKPKLQRLWIQLSSSLEYTDIAPDKKLEWHFPALRCLRLTMTPVTALFTGSKDATFPFGYNGLPATSLVEALDGQLRPLAMNKCRGMKELIAAALQGLLTGESDLERHQSAADKKAILESRVRALKSRLDDDWVHEVKNRIAAVATEYLGFDEAGATDSDNEGDSEADGSESGTDSGSDSDNEVEQTIRANLHAAVVDVAVAYAISLLQLARYVPVRSDNGSGMVVKMLNLNEPASTVAEHLLTSTTKPHLKSKGLCCRMPRDSEAGGGQLIRTLAFSAGGHSLTPERCGFVPDSFQICETHMCDAGMPFYT